MANPTLLTSPIAENGDKNVIPATTGATTGLLDQEHGFQQINELPLQAGGLPPQRKDFNGAFNLLSKILFYAQKGYVFEYDENQDYYAGCVVKDTDGGLYCANTDVLVSSTHPKDDATNWELINFGFNKKETFATSGSFTAPVTGTYRITIQGGGGAGGGVGQNLGGSGGASGAQYTFYEPLTAGTSYSFVIGAGGVVNGGGNGIGGDGGDTSITLNGNVYVAQGGQGGSCWTGAYTPMVQGGNCKSATVNGVAVAYGVCGGGSYSGLGGNGGGAGGGLARSLSGAIPGSFGGGGGGGTRNANVNYNASTGGNGYITFEYCDV